MKTLIFTICFCLFINSRTRNIYIADNQICTITNQIATNQVRCWSDETIKQSHKGNDQFVTLQNNNLCTSTNENRDIKCVNIFNNEIDQYSFYDLDSKDDYFHEVVKGNGFTCIHNMDKVKCQGNETINQFIHSVLFRSITVESILANGKNLCLIFNYYQDSTLIYQIQCISIDEVKISLVPDKFQKIKQSIESSMNYNTICSLAIKVDLICWGECNGQLCIIPSSVRSQVISGTNRILDIKNGFDHGCIVKYPSNLQNAGFGDLVCWGSNDQGQTTIPQLQEKQVRQIDCGKYSTCAIKNNNSLYCFGIIQDKFKFTELSYELLFISTGGRHTCSVNKGNQLCWGNNEQGQLDLHSETRWEVNQGVSAGWDFTCGLKQDQTINCIGFNQQGQTDVSQIPILDTEVNNDKNIKVKVKLISSGLNHSCQVYKIDKLSKLQCWGGQNEYDELSTPFIPDESHDKINTVSVGHQFTCIAYGEDRSDSPHKVTGFNHVLCFGLNESGQCNPIDLNQQLVELTAGAAHACLIKESHVTKSIYCWGSDNQGQRVQIKEEGMQYSITTGDTNTCFVMGLNGIVKCQGSMTFERLDLSGIRVRQIDTTQEYMCIVDKEMTGSCQGDDEWGQSRVPQRQEVQALV